jgi:glutamate dehydrogenase (NAD(P)+)
MQQAASAGIPNHAIPSYLQADHLGPWGNYLQQVDRVTPYLGHLARWSKPSSAPSAS